MPAIHVRPVAVPDKPAQVSRPTVSNTRMPHQLPQEVEPNLLAASQPSRPNKTLAAEAEPNQASNLNKASNLSQALAVDRELNPSAAALARDSPA